ARRFRALYTATAQIRRGKTQPCHPGLAGAAVEDCRKSCHCSVVCTMTQDRDPKHTTGCGVSRRNLLLGTAAGTLGAVSLPGTAKARHDAGPAISRDTGGVIDLSEQHAFYRDGGQAGIETQMQHYVYYKTFDLTSPNRRDLQVLL